jgi:hypothetical protein
MFRWIILNNFFLLLYCWPNYQTIWSVIAFAWLYFLIRIHIISILCWDLFYSGILWFQWNKLFSFEMLILSIIKILCCIFGSVWSILFRRITLSHKVRTHTINYRGITDCLSFYKYILIPRISISNSLFLIQLNRFKMCLRSCWIGIDF